MNSLTPDRPFTAMYLGSQLKAWDKQQTAESPELALTWMRLAGQASFELLSQWVAGGVKVLVGRGHNGADGLVLATQALRAKRRVWVHAPYGIADSQAAQSVWQDFLAAGGECCDRATFVHACVPWVDALLGVGTHRALDSAMESLLDQLGPALLALDVPSGLNADNGSVTARVVEALATITFLGLKSGLFLAEGPRFSGKVFLADCAQGSALAAAIQPVAERIDLQRFSVNVAHREPMTHKGTCGCVLMIGAEPPMSGASVLAARAALRAGTGKVVLTLPTTTASLMSAQLPEIIIPVMDAEHALPEQWLKAAHVIAIGPGLGQSEQAANRLREVLALETTKPLILDADALNVLANNAAVQWTPGVRVLTPHPLEMTRLLKRFAPHAVEANELTQVQQLAQALDAIVVRKGAVSWIAEPKGRVLVIDFGGPELALPGSGDVLTGIIAAILAQTRQTIPLIERVALAVSVHALAGQTLYQQFSDGHLASELCDAIPHALDHLRNLNTKTYNLTLRRHIRSTQVSI